MQGKILPTEKYCTDCPIGRMFCNGCEYHYEMAYSHDHVYCAHPKADKHKPNFNTDTHEGMDPGVSGFTVWVQRGDILYHALLKDHPALAAAERRKREAYLEQLEQAEKQPKKKKKKETLLGALLSNFFAFFAVISTHLPHIKF